MDVPERTDAPERPDASERPDAPDPRGTDLLTIALLVFFLSLIVIVAALVFLAAVT